MLHAASLAPITDSEQAQRFDLSCRALRAVLWAGAVYYVAFAALLKIYAHVPVVVAVVLGVLGVAGNIAIERYLWRRNRARVSQLIDPFTGELPGGRLPLPWHLRWGLPLWSVALIALVVYLAAANASSLPNCGAAGVDAGGEGICVSSNLDGTGEATHNVVDAGHTLHMPGYDVRLLATRVVSTQVTNPSVNPGDYPGGRGWLVSFKLSVTNTATAPLVFDVNGNDTQLLLPDATPTSQALSVLEIVNPNSGPGTPIADKSPIATHSSVAGWVSFVSPSWTPSDLHARFSDLVVFPIGDTTGDYLGELRLWKWANPQGRAALELPRTAQIPTSSPSTTT